MRRTRNPNLNSCSSELYTGGKLCCRCHNSGESRFCALMTSTSANANSLIEMYISNICRHQFELYISNTLIDTRSRWWPRIWAVEEWSSLGLYTRRKRTNVSSWLCSALANSGEVRSRSVDLLAVAGLRRLPILRMVSQRQCRVRLLRVYFAGKNSLPLRQNTSFHRSTILACCFGLVTSQTALIGSTGIAVCSLVEIVIHHNKTESAKETVVD